MAESNNLPEDNYRSESTGDIRLENDILKLKLLAESGATIESDSNLSPELENKFLQQVLQFEYALQNVKYVKVYELLGQPSYKMEQELSDGEILEELNRLEEILYEHNIHLDVQGEYEPRTIYRFITEELFEQETNDLQTPGMIRNFIYEEFHPNHKLDIEHRSRDFMEDWFQRRFNEHSWELSNSFLLNNGTEMTKQEVLQKIHNVFACYSSFRNFQYSINEINFQLNDEDESGFGHSEGSVSYDAITETGEIIPVEGNFKFCLLNEYGWWYITNFEFPGFKW